MPMKIYSCRRAMHHQGFSLIELMVGIVISLIGTLAMMKVFANFEEQKRTTTSGNDAQQNGSYGIYELEREIRTAGSGLVQGNGYGVWGCSLTAYSGGAAVLPPAAAFPAPFATWPITTIFTVPVLVLSGGTDASGNAASDTVAVISGNPSFRVFKASFVSSAGLTTTVDNSVGFLAGDYVLNSVSNGTTNTCTLGQASAVVSPGTTAGNTITLNAALSPAAGFAAGYVFDLGPSPIFSLYAVQAASGATGPELMSYDMLGRTPMVSVADGIVAIKVLYNIDSTASCPTLTSFADSGAAAGIATTWVTPTGNYSYANLTATNLAACNAMAQIKAVRIAVVAQSEEPERSGTNMPTDQYSYSGASSITLFPGVTLTGGAIKVTTQPNYRYKVYDTVIPVRNSFISRLY
jgi:type IV pilus assembly protein PilW